jgi:tetratricopeptide (TPR) repeat protein
MSEVKTRKVHTPEFKAKVAQLSADSNFKVLDAAYKSGKTDDKRLAVKLSEKFIARFPKNPRLEDVYFIAGKAALETDQKEKSQAFFGLLISQFPKSPNTAAAYLSKAVQEEERMDYVAAVDDYQKYFSVYRDLKDRSPKKVTEFKRTILSLLWLTGQTDAIQARMKEKGWCDEDLAEDCHRLRGFLALQEITDKPTDALLKNAFREATEGPKETRAIWAAVALQHQAPLQFGDRLLLARIVAGNWDKLDKPAQAVLLPRVSESVPLAFTLNRKDLNRFAKVKAEAKSIKHRVEMIREMEDTSTQVIKLPWSRIRAAVIHEVAGLYLDLAEQLSAVPPPAGLKDPEIEEYKQTVAKLVFPFEEKGNEIESRALEIAEAYAIEESVEMPIAETYFAKNPSQAKVMKPEVAFKTPPAIDAGLLTSLDSESDWDVIHKKAVSFYQNAADFGRQNWFRAVKEKRWHVAAHFLREAKNRKWWSEDNIQFATAVQMAAEGARGEAVAILEEMAGKWDSGTRKNRLQALLAAIFVKSYAKDKARRTIEAIDHDVAGGMILSAADNEEIAALLAVGAHWTQAKISSWNSEALYTRATQSSVAGVRDWAFKHQSDRKPAGGKPVPVASKSAKTETKQQ